MIKVGGAGGAGGARGTRGVSASRSSEGAFKVEDAGGAGGTPAAAAAGEMSAPAALGALIALQSEGRSFAKNRAAAERALLLLERLRDGLISGRIAVADLAALADAASAKLQDPDERMAAIYGEIALRARVELAKLGRS